MSAAPPAVTARRARSAISCCVHRASMPRPWRRILCSPRRRLRQPVVRSLDVERPPMTAVADRARLEDLNSKLHMLDHVRIERPATPQVQPFRLVTEHLLILPDEDIMQSELAVDITLGDSHMSGV